MGDNKLIVDSLEYSINGKDILKSVFLQCNEGEVVGLFGRNGSGKSTLLKVIFGELTATNKYLNINGMVVQAGFKNRLVAYLPQHSFLPRNISIKKLAKLIVDPSYWNRFKELDVYEVNQNLSAKQLSGGQLRILESYMILYSSCKYLLLDEPFASISPIQVQKMKKTIQCLVAEENLGVIISDHNYQDVIDISQRNYFVSNATVVMVDAREDIRSYYIKS